MTARKVTLRVAGTISLAAAISQFITGAKGVRAFDWRVPSEHLPNVALASLDSELRFYAVWYGAAGVLMHRAATDEVLDQSLRHIIAASWGVAALSRVLSLRRTGRPDGLFIALGAAEAGLAAILTTTK